jgi:hypothetical protein
LNRVHPRHPWIAKVEEEDDTAAGNQPEEIGAEARRREEALRETGEDGLGRYSGSDTFRLPKDINIVLYSFTQ